MQTIHIIVKGRVQGVYYRATAKDVANELGITGWVKNMPDGNVELLACGNEEQIKQFLEWCKKGPKHALVNDMVVTQVEETFFKEFRIIK